ncbi:MAG: HIT family protein [Oscillospiraceae bacterium]|nr:HIT family protein [Oscillospiraceae bacterium]
MSECVYCKYAIPSHVVKVCDLDSSKVFLFKEQTHAGRCVVVEKNHHRELFELSDAELCGFMRDVSLVAKAINELYHPDKINYGSFSDTMGHIHFHIVPKWEGKEEWGGTFVISLDKTYLSDAEYAARAKQLADEIEKLRKHIC